MGRDGFDMQEEQYADLYWDREPAEKEKFIAQLAPIVLFTYNRLKHTKQTIEALQENVYASDSELFIYSDAPKTDKAVAEVQAVRDYLHSINGFKKITIIERDENWGLARNIIDGVTSIVNKYGKIIVLEDDIVTSRYFLKYMNDALKIYENESRVMEINGYAAPMETEGLPETYFLEFADCWGWATWDRAWKFFKRNPEELRDSFSQEEIKKFNLDGAYKGFWQQVLDNCDGRLYTWAIFWHAAIFQNNGISLMVRDSLVINEGFDGSGEHCSNNDCFFVPINNCAIEKYPIKICENLMVRKRIKNFYKKTNSSFLSRIKGFLKRRL